MNHVWQKIEDDNLRLKILYEVDADDDTITTNFQQEVYDLDLPFFHTHRLFKVYVEHKTADGIVEKPRYGLHHFGDHIFFDNTNEAIYEVAKRDLHLTVDNVAEYARFFFSHVEGRHGHFYPVFSMDDIPLLPEPWDIYNPESKEDLWSEFQNVRQIEDILATRVDEVDFKEGKFYLEFLVIFKQSIFMSELEIEEETGFITMHDEELLLEGVPTSEQLLEKRLQEYWYNIPKS